MDITPKIHLDAPGSFHGLTFGCSMLHFIGGLTSSTDYVAGNMDYDHIRGFDIWLVCHTIVVKNHGKNP